MAHKASSLKAKNQAASAIDALFGVSQGEQVASGLKLIEHSQIEVKSQPRTTFSATEVSELARSIAQLRERGEGIEGSGILQPLLVTALPQPNGTARYRLVAGERRYRASQEAGLKLVPCLVVAMRDDAVLLAQLIENLQRQDLAPLEEAHAFQQLHQEQKLSLRDIAKSMGKTLGYVTNRLGLLKMGPDVQEMVFLRKNTLMHAQHIDAVSDAALRKELIRAVVEEDASIKEVERRISANSVDTALPSATSLPTQNGFLQTNRKSSSNTHEDAGTPSIAITSRNGSRRQVDPLNQAITPAISLLTEALRQMGETEITSSSKGELAQALKQLKSIVQELEKRVGLFF